MRVQLEFITKEFSLCHKLLFLNPYILTTQWSKLHRVIKVYVSSNDIITIKINNKEMLKNHKKINKQKKFFFNKGVDPSDGKKRTQIKIWKTIICKQSLYKECFKTIIIA